MDISFVIVNYKSFRYLENCLKSIIKSSNDFEFEIIIVNNDEEKLDKIDCFSEDCLEVIGLNDQKEGINKKETSKKYTILEINKNIGFGKASNIGSLFSRGKYICFINPDVEIKSKSIKKIINEFELSPEIGIIGPKILEKVGTDGIEVVQDWSVGVDLTPLELLLGKIGLSKSKKFLKICKKTEADWVTGACLFIKKRVFLKAGGFDENFFLYYEDVDLCKSVKRLGYKIFYYPQFKVLHLGGKSSNNKYQQKLEYFKSQDYFYKKWFSGWSYFVLKFLRFFYFWRYKI